MHHLIKTELVPLTPELAKVFSQLPTFKGDRGTAAPLLEYVRRRAQAISRLAAGGHRMSTTANSRGISRLQWWILDESSHPRGVTTSVIKVVHYGIKEYQDYAKGPKTSAQSRRADAAISRAIRHLKSTA